MPQSSNNTYTLTVHFTTDTFEEAVKFQNDIIDFSQKNHRTKGVFTFLRGYEEGEEKPVKGKN